MSKLIDEAVEVLRGLPENLQAAAARAILDYGAQCDDDLQLSDEQAIEVDRRMADPNRATTFSIAYVISGYEAGGRCDRHPGP